MGADAAVQLLQRRIQRSRYADPHDTAVTAPTVTAPTATTPTVTAPTVTVNSIRDFASVNIVGAGPTGALLAILLQRRGLKVTLYESRRDPRGNSGESGRSINLALADRGMHALKVAGVSDDIAAALVTMRGRLVHEK